MSEQQATTEAQTSKCLHPEAVGKRWGDPISEERQAELQATLDAWNSSSENLNYRKGPFTGVWLTGAEVYWLAEQSGRNRYGRVPDLHMESALLYKAHLEGADLRAAHIQGASLHGAYLEGAVLEEAHLEGADLFETHLIGAELIDAHLEGAELFLTHLEGADLSGCWLDSKSILRDATIDHMTRFGDIHWNGVGAVDLTQIDWERAPNLGDESDIRLFTEAEGHAGAVRAYRQLAAQLRAQGMTEVADRYTYRAQVRQRWAYLNNLLHDWRRPWRWPRDFSRYIGSLFLAVLAGYGYRPGRTLFWYVMTVLSYMGGYLLVTHSIPLFGLTEPAGTQPLHWYEALVLSLASFHGRGFFPQGISLGDPVAILAASEAVIGLFIEISFIATFTQRYFAR